MSSHQAFMTARIRPSPGNPVNPVTRRYFEDSIRTHRWWAAIAATLLTPWIGPHVDQYVPMCQVLFQAGAENADRGFWVIAAVALVVIYLAWLVLFSGLAAWLARRRRDLGSSSVPGNH